MLADAAVAFVVAWTWALQANPNGCAWARVDRMIDFTAFRPFVTRALAPQMIGILARITPEVPVLPIGIPPGLELATLLVSSSFLLLTVRAARRLQHSTMAHPAPVATRSILAWCAALSVLVLMIGRTQIYGMIYDPATLGLTIFAVALLAERAWRAYVLIFLAACMNRETAMFLIPVFILYAWPEMSCRRFLELLVTQIVGFVAIRGLIELAAVGTGVVPPVRDSLSAFLPTLGAGAVIIASSALLVAGVIRAPRTLGPALLLVPISVVAFLAQGNPGEYRVFLEAVPAFVIAAAVVCGGGAPVTHAIPNPTGSGHRSP